MEFCFPIGALALPDGTYGIATKCVINEQLLLMSGDMG